MSCPAPASRKDRWNQNFDHQRYRQRSQALDHPNPMMLKNEAINLNGQWESTNWKKKQYRFCVMCDSLQLMSAVYKCRKFEHIMKHSCLYFTPPNKKLQLHLNTKITYSTLPSKRGHTLKNPVWPIPSLLHHDWINPHRSAAVSESAEIINKKQRSWKTYWWWKKIRRKKQLSLVVCPVIY